MVDPTLLDIGMVANSTDCMVTWHGRSHHALSDTCMVGACMGIGKVASSIVAATDTYSMVTWQGRSHPTLSDIGIVAIA